MIAAALRDGLRSYSEQLPIDGDVSDLDAWLLDLLLAAHRLNAGNGRVYWELSALTPELSGELAAFAAERRERRRRFAAAVTVRMWRATRTPGRPPRWLTDTVAVHLSAFTTQSLAGDFGRTPEDVAHTSARALRAALDAATSEAADGATELIR
jgi:hypothetical protein